MSSGSSCPSPSLLSFIPFSPSTHQRPWRLLWCVRQWECGLRGTGPCDTRPHPGHPLWTATAEVSRAAVLQLHTKPQLLRVLVHINCMEHASGSVGGLGRTTVVPLHTSMLSIGSCGWLFQCYSLRYPLYFPCKWPVFMKIATVHVRRRRVSCHI